MPLIDMHAHWGEWPFGCKPQTVERLCAMLDRYDISAMLFSSSKAIQYDMEEGNRELFTFLEADSRLYGYVTGNPNFLEQSLEEIRRYSCHPRFKGIKYHPCYANLTIDSPEMDPIYAVAQEMQLPVLVHAMGNTTCSPLRMIPVNHRYPALRLIGAHTGGSFPDLACQAARETNENVYFDLSCGYIGRGRVEKIVHAAGADRVLFGSDYALIDPIFIKGEVDEANILPAEREKILFSNSAALFQL